MFETLIRGGTVVEPHGVRRADIAIAQGRIAALLSPAEPATAVTVVDAAGAFLLPGLVDAHAHLREPGLTHKEDFSSGTHAAALGGVTTVLDMPTDEPWTATADQLVGKMALARDRIHVDVGFQVAVTRDIHEIERLCDFAPVSFELFTADVPRRFEFATLDAVAEILRELRRVDALVGISPGDQSILLASRERHDTDDIAAFLASRPPLAEANGIARAILAAQETGARIHIRQINSAAGLNIWTRLRALADASIETTVQNFFFTAADYEEDGARLKASPPFRTRADVDALRAALRAGLIDTVATDHAPHSPAEKAASYPSFADIPGGMPGLQTLLPAMLKLVDEGVVEFPDIARLCARNPAERFGLGRSKGRIAIGHDADIVVVVPGRGSVISDADQVSRAAYTPFNGMHVRQRLERVFLRGREIVRDGRLIAPAQGKVVTRA